MSEGFTERQNYDEQEINVTVFLERWYFLPVTFRAGEEEMRRVKDEIRV